MRQLSRKRVERAMIEVCSAASRKRCDEGGMLSLESIAAPDCGNAEPRLFGVLLGLHEDWIEPGQLALESKHRNIEIISYILEGTLEHRDSLGNETLVRPGDLQLLGSGNGVVHSEGNNSPTETLHYLRISLEPNSTELDPYYEQRHLQQPDRNDRIFLLASPDGREGSVTVRQDVCLYNVVLNAGELLRQSVPKGRRGYLHVARGAVVINEFALQSGDSAVVNSEADLTLKSPTRGEALWFDLP